MVNIGIDIGGTGIKCGCVDENGAILSKVCAPTQNIAETIIHCAARLCREAAAACSIELSDIGCIGVGCPGLVDAKNGIVIKAGNIKAFENLMLSQLLEEELKTPVYLQNDVYCALTAEAVLGAAAQCNSCAMITIGTGIGGGAFLNRRDFYAGDMISELGHHVIVVGGRPCSCGNKGCFEAYSSCAALIAQMEERLEEKGSDSALYSRCDHLTAEDVFEAVKSGDLDAVEVIRAYIAHLTAALQNIDLLLKPEVIVIGGGLSAQGDVLLELIHENINAQDHILVNKAMKLKISNYKNNAGIVGASLLGRVSSL